MTSTIVQKTVSILIHLKIEEQERNNKETFCYNVTIWSFTNFTYAQCAICISYL